MYKFSVHDNFVDLGAWFCIK